MVAPGPSGDTQKPAASPSGTTLAKVWDGSKSRVGDNLGYWGCMAVACEPGKRRGVVPLQFRLWSTEDPEYKGENAEIEAIIDSIRAEVGNRCRASTSHYFTVRQSLSGK